jgi:polyhydroxyalkanoate synthesis regulator phasin
MDCKEAADEISRLRSDVERLTSWVADLQSGMYVNCVYCGHRYGPGETTPVSMADALKAHIETCPQHPMSALRAENLALHEQVAALESREVCTVAHEDVWTCGYCQRDRLRSALERATELIDHMLEGMIIDGRIARASLWSADFGLVAQASLIELRAALSPASPPDDAGEGHD